jgi:hypothetical protein
MGDSNTWLIGGTGSVRNQNFHCNETIAMITEGSWTTPAEPTWIPEVISSREDGTTTLDLECLTFLTKDGVQVSLHWQHVL